MFEDFWVRFGAFLLEEDEAQHLISPRLGTDRPPTKSGLFPFSLFVSIGVVVEFEVFSNQGSWRLDKTRV